ncbi:MAG: Trm112 family protein [Nitriliruptorales bacterium]|nr:Trm112 family protein [Nitriliruptorales bacterium]
MGLDQRLLEILRCPDCRAEVEYKDRRKVIVCSGCGLQYPVVDGIPVMLVEEATKKRGA